MPSMILPTFQADVVEEELLIQIDDCTHNIDSMFNDVVNPPTVLVI